MVTDQHSRYLARSATNEELSLEHYRTNLRKFCPKVIGKYIWNNIPFSIRSKSPKKVFKKVSSAFFSRTVLVLVLVLVLVFPGSFFSSFREIKFVHNQFRGTLLDFYIVPYLFSFFIGFNFLFIFSFIVNFNLKL